MTSLTQQEEASPVDSNELPIPPEILTVILELSLLSPRLIKDRNSRLLDLALVSRQFQPVAYDLLWGDLRVSWLAGTAMRVQRSLRANRSLAPIVKRLQVNAVDQRAWISAWVHRIRANPAQLAAARRRARTFRLATSNSERLVDTPCAKEDERREENARLEEMLSREGSEAWVNEGHARWTRPDEAGQELLQLVGLLPSLRHLVVKNWKHDVPPPGGSSARLESARAVLSHLETFAADSCTDGLTAFVNAEARQLDSFHLTDHSPKPLEKPHSALHLRLTYNFFPATIAPLCESFATRTLQQLDITASSSPTMNGISFGHAPSLASWEVLLSRLPHLQALKIRVTQSACPNEADQAAFSPYLRQGSLSSLSVEFWPTRELLSALPSTLIYLGLGRFDDAFPSISDEAFLTPWGVHGILSQQTLRSLQRVGMPYAGGFGGENWTALRERFAESGWKLEITSGY
ncbi:hypothetical protein RQP46_007201 [Phenoliferia psychrophenolica]